MFEVNDDGSVLIKTSAILGEAVPNTTEIKRACHALAAKGLVERFRKEAVLSFREQKSTLESCKGEKRRTIIAEAAEKSTAISLDELEQEIHAHILSNQVN